MLCLKDVIIYWNLILGRSFAVLLDEGALMGEFFPWLFYQVALVAQLKFVNVLNLLFVMLLAVRSDRLHVYIQVGMRVDFVLAQGFRGLGLGLELGS